jgi:hypothetical protein
MKIELRKINISLSLSEETTAFTADIYVDSKRIAYARNDGNGGSTHYSVYDAKDIPLLKKVETYCENLPDYTYPNYSLNDEPLTVKMNLEQFIDNLIDEELTKKEKAKFQKRLQKDMLTGICVGTDEAYGTWKFKITLADLLAKPNGKEALAKTIEKAKAGLKEGERILNTNIPAELL